MDVKAQVEAILRKKNPRATKKWIEFEVARRFPDSSDETAVEEPELDPASEPVVQEPDPELIVFEDADVTNED